MDNAGLDLIAIAVCLLAGATLVGDYVIYLGLKGLPGWKEYISSKPEKIDKEHLSAHLPKK